MGKKSKDHKKKKSKSKKQHSDSSTCSSSSSSRSTSRDRARASKTEQPASKTAKETLDDFFKKNSDSNYYLAQKSEVLMFDQIKETENNSESFVWRKKNQKIGLDKLDPQKVLLLNSLKQDETARELEKLKKRKIEREREREEREREREFLQRQKETEYHKEWEKQEDSFQLKQVKLRSKIRIEEGRAKPIDLLAKYINAEDDDLAIEMHEPYTYLNGLTIRDLEDLLVDIKIYSDLELGINSDYWNDITIVTEEELKKLQKLDKNSREHAGDRREGINQSVLQDVGIMFKNKTYDQLVELEKSIKKKIDDETGIDIGYWESLLAQLKAHMARARLRDRHKKLMQEKFSSLKKEQGIKDEKKSGNDDVSFERRIRDRIRLEEQNYKAIHESKNENDDDEVRQELEMKENLDEQDEAGLVDELSACINDYHYGNYSPILMSPDDLPLDAFAISQEEDLKDLELKRRKVKGVSNPDFEEEFEMKAIEKIGIGAEEEEPSAVTSKEAEQKSNTQEVAITNQHYSWSDKYRPRKPRYYNRVHTGYDWNQYNKKHYDVDNPPPKTVQGYKLNIFYPDMIDKTKTPHYSIIPCQDNKDFAVLRFHAGPPYEDVAFKIVNREWDISHRHGFRNQFQNGIYQLWFHFRKWKYRR